METDAATRQSEASRRFQRELSRAFKMSVIVAAFIVTIAGAAILATGGHARMLAMLQVMALFGVVLASSLFLVCGAPEAAIRTWIRGIAARAAARIIATLCVGLIVHRVMYSMFDGRETFRTFGQYLAKNASSSPLRAFAPFVVPLLFFAAYAAAANRARSSNADGD